MQSWFLKSESGWNPGLNAGAAPVTPGAERVCCAACLWKRQRQELLVWKAKRSTEVGHLAVERRRNIVQSGQDVALEQHSLRLGHCFSGQPVLDLVIALPAPHRRRGAVPLYCPDHIAVARFLASPDRQMVPPLLHLCYLWKTLCLWEWAHMSLPSGGRCLSRKCRRNIQIYTPPP